MADFEYDHFEYAVVDLLIEEVRSLLPFGFEVLPTSIWRMWSIWYRGIVQTKHSDSELRRVKVGSFRVEPVAAEIRIMDVSYGGILRFDLADPDFPRNAAVGLLNAYRVIERPQISTNIKQGG